MSSFAKLKASRIQKEATRSVTRANSTTSQLDSETAVVERPVDSHGASRISSERTRLLLDTSEQSKFGVQPCQNLQPQSIPPDLEVRSDGIHGRGIWSRKMRGKGHTLLAEIPSVATLSTRYLLSHCSACFVESPDKPLKRCPACRTIYYCESDCQTRDWPLHKRECSALQKWAITAPPASSHNEEPVAIVASDAIRALGRVVWRRQRKGGENEWVKAIDAMQSHRTSISKNEHTSQLHTHMAHALVRYLGLESVKELTAYGIESITALVDLISSFTANAFALTSPSLTPIGVCISPTIGLFNHSCDPNAVLVFPWSQNRSRKEQPMAEIIAIRDIAEDEEIVISYVDSTLPRDQRREALQETYHFVCDCPLCNQQRQPGTSADPREGMNCPKKCGATCWLPTTDDPLTRCSQCGAIVKDTDAVLDALRVGQEALDKATRVQFSDPPKAIQLTTNLISILTSVGLLPSSHPLLALSRLDTLLHITHFRSPFDSDTIELNSPQVQEEQQITCEAKSTLDDAQNHLDEAIRSATRTCNALNQVLPYGHPARGLAIAELGKLLSVDEPKPKHLIEEGSQSTLLAPSTSSPSSSTSPFATSVAYPPSGPPRLKLAYDTLIRARAELMIGFGGRNEGGAVGTEIRKLLVDVEKELGIWRDGIRSAMRDVPKGNGNTKQ